VHMCRILHVHWWLVSPALCTWFIVCHKPYTFTHEHCYAIRCPMVDMYIYIKLYSQSAIGKLSHWYLLTLIYNIISCINIFDSYCVMYMVSTVAWVKIIKSHYCCVILKGFCSSRSRCCNRLGACPVARDRQEAEGINKGKRQNLDS